ncbi:hypothetical protein GDO78_014381 [Eleutherodactylus coqui]|uniref:Uncharacterized protein n=1 Tax=Eleutherodactylus coqui TaxID=57060 RepID=A0A8J6C3X2_ELECQ|nr:hypothetical protein GDO78_014381 [Eleutherodactylus coqui]
MAPFEWGFLLVGDLSISQSTNLAQFSRPCENGLKTYLLWVFHFKKPTTDTRLHWAIIVRFQDIFVL